MSIGVLLLILITKYLVILDRRVEIYILYYL
jgi:hypothetical protein